MSFKIFHQKMLKLWLYKVYPSFHSFHAPARACVCAQNNLRVAHLHYTPINPKKVLAQLGEQFLRTLADKKSTGEQRRKKE